MKHTKRHQLASARDITYMQGWCRASPVAPEDVFQDDVVVEATAGKRTPLKATRPWLSSSARRPRFPMMRVSHLTRWRARLRPRAFTRRQVRSNDIISPAAQHMDMHMSIISTAQSALIARTHYGHIMDTLFRAHIDMSRDETTSDDQSIHQACD